MIRFVLLSLVLCSCSKHVEKEQLPVYTDTVFLGYAFSMDMAAFEKHTDDLVNSGELVLQKDKIVFPFAMQNRDHSAVFSPEFGQDGKMGKLIVSVTEPAGVPRLIQANIYGKLLEKYGDLDLWKESPGYLPGSMTFTYQHGNLKIRLMEGTTDARITYENLSQSPDSVAPNVSH